MRMKLLERDGAIAELQATLDGAGAGQGQVLLLGGEAGVGKSSLIRQFIDLVDGTVQVLIGACDPLSSPHPLAPILDVVPQLGARISALSHDPAHRPELFGALREHLVTGPPTLFVIEDVHWADEASLDFLLYLGRRIAPARSLLIVSYRDDEIGVTHPLRAVIGHFTTMSHVRRLNLRPLSAEAVAVLASGTQVDPVELYQQTGGNPFYVTEVLASGTTGIPATVRDAVLARAARLSSAGRAVLDAAAVIGFRTEPWLIATVIGDSVGACDECIDAGLLIAHDGVMLFRHELARAAVLEAISPIRLTALHATVLAALRSRGEHEESPVRLAHHAEASGNGAAVLLYAPQAARRAAGIGAHREAAAQYARALRFAHGLSDVEREPLLAAHLAECHAIGANDEIVASAQSLITIARANGNREAEAKWEAWRATALVSAGKNAAAEAASRRSLDLVAESPASPEQLFAYGTQASLRMLNRDLDDGVLWAERTLALAGELGDAQARIRALNTLGASRILGGDLSRGEADLNRSRELATVHGLEADAAAAYSNLGSSFGEVYAFAAASRYLEEGIAYASARDIDRHSAYMTAWLALTRLYQGAWTEAADLARRVLRNPASVVISRIMALLALGRIRARRGDPEVMALLDEALELSLRTATLQRLGPVRAARAEAAWLAGRLDDADAEARAVFDLATFHGHRWHIGEISFWLWRAGEIAEPPALAAEPFARQMAGDWAGAAAAWQALGCSYESARALAESSSEEDLRSALATFEQLGARPDAGAVVSKLRRLGFNQIPRGPRPTTRANAAGLTPREAEVLRLIAGGCSNADIAERLFLSGKTVEHHVSAILGKLNVQSRRDAAMVAQERQLLT